MTTFLTRTTISRTHMSNLEYIQKQLCYAEEQLDLADDLASRTMWGNRCDVLEAALRDYKFNDEVEE